MSDSEIIWKFLVREYTDSHPVIYLYTSNRPRSSMDSFNKVVDLTTLIFGDVYPPSLIKPVVKRFLEFKKSQYMRGEINIKPIY
jgi:hypothetical protein